MFTNKKLLLILLLIIASTISVYYYFVVIPKKAVEQAYDGAKEIGDQINKALQFTPEVSVENTIVVKQHTELLELATSSQKFTHTYSWKNTWLHSEKEINVSGTFDAKIGFDLMKRFSITIHDDGKKAEVVCPEPELLSLTSLQDIEFTDDNGVWNRIGDEDRSKAINEFTMEASKFAQEKEFLDNARKSLEHALIEILKNHVSVAVIIIGKDTTTYELSETKTLLPQVLD